VPIIANFKKETNGFSITINGNVIAISGTYSAETKYVSDTKFSFIVYQNGKIVYGNVFNTSDFTIQIAGVAASGDINSIVSQINAQIPTDGGGSNGTSSFENAATYAAINTANTTKRFIEVAADENNAGQPSLYYYYSGTKILNLSSGGATGTSSAEQSVTLAYTNAVGATQTEKDALVTFTDDAVNGGFYNDLVAFYPFVGTSEILKRRNLLDPDDTDSAFRLLVSAGAPTSVAKGVSMVQNGVDKYKIQIDPTLIGGQPNIGIGVYFPVPTQAQIYGGHVNLTILPYNSSFIWVGLANTSGGNEVASTNTYKNHFLFQRKDASTLEVYNQATLLGSPARTSSGLPANPIEFWVRSEQGAAATYSAFYITRYLTSTKYQALHTALQKLMTTLGRTT
jgi:hypothetical protein